MPNQFDRMGTGTIAPLWKGISRRDGRPGRQARHARDADALRQPHGRLGRRSSQEASPGSTDVLNGIPCRRYWQESGAVASCPEGRPARQSERARPGDNWPRPGCRSRNVEEGFGDRDQASDGPVLFTPKALNIKAQGRGAHPGNGNAFQPFIPCSICIHRTPTGFHNVASPNRVGGNDTRHHVEPRRGSAGVPGCVHVSRLGKLINRCS